VDIIKRLQLIETQLLFPKTLASEEGEIFIKRPGRVEVATDGNVTFYLQVESVNVWPEGDGLKSGIKIFKGNILLGKSSLKTNYSRNDGTSEFRPWFNQESIAVDAGDIIQIGNVEVKIVRILSQDTEGRLVGDEHDGIVIQRKIIRNITTRPEVDRN